MKICLIDHDPVQSHLMSSKMTKLGHEVSHFPVKQDAIEALETYNFDVILCDPSPMRDATPVLMEIKRHARNAAYSVLMLNEDSDTPQSPHCNHAVTKPIALDDLQSLLNDAERFIRLSDDMVDITVDYPSAGGVISKSAFCQLYLSAIDRSGRYSEQNSLLIFTIEGFEKLIDMDGDYAAAYVAAQLSQFLVEIRRQSDIIGQIADNQFALLLQRPQHAQEPIEAAKRFAKALEGHKLILENNIGPVTIDVSLILLPSGHENASYRIQYKRTGS